MKKFRFSLQINELAESKEFKKHSFFYECTVVNLRPYGYIVYARTLVALRPYTRSVFNRTLVEKCMFFDFFTFC